jgi:hypothetical protein
LSELDEKHQSKGHGHDHEHAKKEKVHHHKNLEVHHFDPATNQLIENTKKSMIELNNIKNNEHMNKQEAMKSMAKEQTEITDHIKQYLSKADKFSVRMSAAISKS